MQNSGLGTSLNALASLSLMYGLPALLLVTWRGYQGKDAPEHILMGDISPKLLTLCGIPHRVLSAASIEADLSWAVAEMEQRLSPVALLVPPGVVEIAIDASQVVVRAPQPRDQPGRAAERVARVARTIARMEREERSDELADVRRHPRREPAQRSARPGLRRAARCRRPRERARHRERHAAQSRAQVRRPGAHRLAASCQARARPRTSSSSWSLA